VPPADVSRLLSRIANDADFAALLTADPDTALAEYHLTAAEERRFREGGSEALALLTFQAQGQEPPPARAPTSPQPPMLSGQPLPQVAFLLEVTPTVQPGPDGAPQIAHTASLHTPDTPRSSLAGVVFQLRIAPLATPQPDGSMQVGYTAAIEPLSVALDPEQHPDTAVPTRPWDHDTDSPSAQQAAAAVHAAAPEDRLQAILDLVAAVTGGSS